MKPGRLILAIILGAAALKGQLLQSSSFGVSSGSAAPTGSAGGDLNGTYPNPGVAKVNGNTPGGTCTNQVVTADSTSAVPTCSTLTLASAFFANQGTTSTFLHGNASGNPSFSALGIADTPLTTRGDLLVANSTPAIARLALGAANTVLHGSATDPIYSNVVVGDFGSSIAARAGLENATAAAAAPTFSTTADRLAYQTAEIPAYVFVTSTFTTSGSGTALEAITGLTWTMPGSTALNIPFHCALVYHQNSSTAAVGFGFQNATTGATNLLTSGIIYTSATVFAAANVANTTATTATTVVSGTPSAITTNWNATLDGLIEQPSGTASVFTIRVSTATQADTVSVLRGSYCRIG